MTDTVDELARRRWFRAKVRELGDLLCRLPGHRRQLLLTDDKLTRPAPPADQQDQVPHDDTGHRAA